MGQQQGLASRWRAGAEPVRLSRFDASTTRHGCCWQTVPVRKRIAGALLGCALVLSACSDDPEPVPQPSVPDQTAPPVYDPELEPAAAAMALVPADATILVVTDYDELRLRLEQDELTSESSDGERQRFWRDAEQRAVLLSPGVLRADDDRLLRDYGFTQDDVSWEARFVTPTGAGFVLKLREDLDLTGVEKAVADGVGPLAGALLDEGRFLVGTGAAASPTDSWAADPDRLAVVGDNAATTYVDASCIPSEVALGPAAADAADVLEDLDELSAFSVSYGTELVTVELGLLRGDVFDRARLPDLLSGIDPEFTRTYRDPVADPSGGRIGYRLGDPDVAERLATERRLPFAVCAG